MRIRLTYGRYKEEFGHIQSAADLIDLLARTPYTRVQLRNLKNESVELRRESLGFSWSKSKKSVVKNQK